MGLLWTLLGPLRYVIKWVVYKWSTDLTNSTPLCRYPSVLWLTNVVNPSVCSLFIHLVCHTSTIHNTSIYYGPFPPPILQNPNPHFTIHLTDSILPRVPTLITPTSWLDPLIILSSYLSIPHQVSTFRISRFLRLILLPRYPPKIRLFTVQHYPRETVGKTHVWCFPFQPSSLRWLLRFTVSPSSDLWQFITGPKRRTHPNRPLVRP